MVRDEVFGRFSFFSEKISEQGCYNSFPDYLLLRIFIMEQAEWERLSPEQKKIQLYLEQKKTLEAFLERGAISKAQFDKSLGDLTVKMGMSGLID